jgi:predicted nucleotidyltransferase
MGGKAVIHYFGAMGQLAELRDKLRQERLGRLSASVAPLVAGREGAEVWLFGSWARGDWDARSDVDLIAVAPLASEAESLADRLIQDLLGDDVIALETSDWQARRSGGDPHWRAIGRDAILIAAGSRP